MSATSWLNVVLIIMGISIVLTYSWVHESIHWAHYFTVGAVAYAAGLAAAREKYDHEMQLYNVYLICKERVSAGLQASCPKQSLPMPSGLAYHPERPSLGNTFLEGLKSVPFVFLGVLIGLAILLAWNVLNPKHPLESHLE